ALETSKGEFVLLLNSDTIIQKGALPQLLSSFANHPLEASTAHLSSARDKLDHLGILAATLLNSDGSHQPQGGSLPSLISLFTMMFFIDDLPVVGTIFPTVQETGQAAKHRQFIKHQLTNKLIQKGWVAGTAMMIRKEVINDIGLLDSNIFMYGEDIEYCLRAKNHHWDVAIDPQAKVTHLGSASSSSENAILGEIQAYLYIWAKHKPHWQRRFAKMILYWGLTLRIFIYKFIISRPTRAKTYKKALDLLN
ncbi:MAG: Family 2 glycosyl transferase, partial [Microgenomates bacterium 39_7]